MDYIIGNYNYWVTVILMMTGFYIVINSGNLVKKLIGLSVFQTSILLMYISASKVSGARFPILQEGVTVYSNPLPHVLMLTAIVVGIATISVGLALVVRIKEEYGTIEEDEILSKDLRLIVRSKKEIKEEMKKSEFIEDKNLVLKKPDSKPEVKKPVATKSAAKKLAAKTATKKKRQSKKRPPLRK